MGKNNNIIEINGIKYDTRTGVALSSNVPVTSKPTAVPLKNTKRPTMRDVVRQPAKHAAARSPKPSSTLMRTAVKKPTASLRKHGKAQGQMDVVAHKATSQALAKPSAKRLDNKRLLKARRVPQSKLIQHFSPITSDSNKFAAISAPTPLTTQPLPQSQPTAPVALGPDSKKPRTTAELLDHALKHATSHEQKAPNRHKSRRGLKIATTAALLLVIMGVVISQQMPNLRMHLASAKAGFHASLPDYKPAGFSLSKLDSSGGVIATTFDSNSDQRHYTLTQKTSNWDSQALRDNFVTGHDKNYKVTEAAGRTVYIYGDHDATWVNAGIWYIVQTDGSLTNQQLADLASSL